MTDWLPDVAVPLVELRALQASALPPFFHEQGEMNPDVYAQLLRALPTAQCCVWPAPTITRMMQSVSLDMLLPNALTLDRLVGGMASDCEFWAMAPGVEVGPFVLTHMPSLLLIRVVGEGATRDDGLLIAGILDASIVVVLRWYVNNTLSNLQQQLPPLPESHALVAMAYWVLLGLIARSIGVMPLHPVDHTFGRAWICCPDEDLGELAGSSDGVIQ